MTIKKRIGFCCKWMLTTDPKPDKNTRELERKFNTSSTTVAWLNRQLKPVAEDKLWSVAKHNLQSVQNVLHEVAKLPQELHMMRISSDLLPVYTEPTWSYFWQQQDVKDYCAAEFAKIGELARQYDIRLSFHPGQFCVLASDNPDVVTRSIEEFEYHVDMARWMGYGSSWHDHGFKINVHIAGKQGPTGIVNVLPKLSTEARNLITIENDEMSWGIDASIDLKDSVALVLDIHHHLIHSNGLYLSPKDDRWKKIIDSWRGTRPVIHYSLSREEVLAGHDTNVKPDVNKILTEGISNKSKLRAHSDAAWNRASNLWALEFWPDADIQFEAKFKNIASMQLYEDSKTI
jgi:UV DNA damage endonuclease